MGQVEYRIGQNQTGGKQYSCLNGIAMGFAVGLGSTGGVTRAANALSSHIGTQLECLSMGLTNNLTDPTSILNAVQGWPGTVVWAVPMVPMSGGSMYTLLNGGYDTLITTYLNRLVTLGWGGANSVLRVGWEFNTSQYPWCTGSIDPNTKAAVGLANYKAGAQHWVNLASAAGFTGFFDWCGGNQDTRQPGVATWDPQTTWPKNKTILGFDCYIQIGNPYSSGGYGKNDPQDAWSVYAKPILDQIVTYCRANGYLTGMGEYGMTYSPTSAYQVNDNSYFFPTLHDYCASVADVMAYGNLYHQNQSADGTLTGASNLTERHQLFYFGGIAGTVDTVRGTGPSPTNAAPGTDQNADPNSTTIVDTTSPNKTSAWNSWLDNYGGRAGKGSGSMQVTTSTSTTPSSPAGGVLLAQTNTKRRTSVTKFG